MHKMLLCVSAIAIIILIVLLSLRTEKFASNPPEDPEHATYTQAYLLPTKMLHLPPLVHLSSASHQPLDVNTGLPKSMFKGSDKVNMNFTSDMLWCKQTI